MLAIMCLRPAGRPSHERLIARGWEHSDPPWAPASWSVLSLGRIRTHRGKSRGLIRSQSELHGTLSDPPGSKCTESEIRGTREKMEYQAFVASPSEHQAWCQWEELLAGGGAWIGRPGGRSGWRKGRSWTGQDCFPDLASRERPTRPR